MKSKEHRRREKAGGTDRGSQNTGVQALTAGGMQSTAPSVSLGLQGWGERFWGPLCTSFLAAKVLFTNTQGLKTVAPSRDLSLSRRSSGSYSGVSA